MIEVDQEYYVLKVTQNDSSFNEETFKSNPETIVPEHLSNKSRGSVSIRLPFAFPFYGHDISNVFLTTEGFISLADRIHSHVRRHLEHTRV